MLEGRGYFLQKMKLLRGRQHDVRARLGSLGKRGLFLNSAFIVYQLCGFGHIVSFLCEIGISQEYREDKKNNNKMTFVTFLTHVCAGKRDLTRSIGTLATMEYVMP